MADVEYVNATCHYPGTPTPAVSDLNLTINEGEFMVLVGPSGSGKSTAMRMLAGLENVTSGEIRVNGTDVSRVQPKDRDIAMVFQNYALYPHMSVRDNMAFALKLRGVSKADREVKVLEAARLLDLERFLDRKPKALSGGQRQRVAMGRAIVREPSVFLMDEPLSNLDAKLRVETRANIAEIQARLATTTLYVTHDQVEAMTMGHRVAVLKDGILQQVDTPRALYDTPANVFVAGFIGSPSMNLRPVTVEGAGRVKLAEASVTLPGALGAAVVAQGLDHLTIGLRPESFRVSEVQADGALRLQVTLVEELGSDSFIYGSLTTDSGDQARLIVRSHARTVPRIGDDVAIDIDPAQIHGFHPESGLRLA
ncbi:ABC transporter ATP-binding protein [Nocardioides baekrokdamisoli]|uniref:ABC transporter ATP-binding protein n=1 Tax=Nocardioides baekrokdamisoli TaxID=1804624 RepID=A0A3G9J1W2_9ACTN|nr:sn-glycerol-3-phosphate ABC transporter ATP-binding protein UgpC [Nocardioides baekrokdamisoli]BBH17548.1 ABC transporter ATP-binding protein [Nocardioides baekrokdamisoli]